MAPRVVSLVPSATETLLSLGANVVGCTRFCEQPHIPSVGGTKNPDVAAIVESAPDLVVLDREENRREDHDALVDAGLDVFVSSVTTVADGVAVVGRLAELVGVPAPSGIEPELIVAGPPAPAERSLLRAFVPIWRRPWMTIGAGTYGGDLLRHLGVELVPTSDDPYPTVELDAVAAHRPEVVLVPSEPYAFTDRHVAELADACGAASVHRVDGQDLFWWGSRTAGAISRLRGAVEPLRSA